MSDRPGVGVGVLLADDYGRVLIGQRRGAHGAGTWSVPGGWMEFGESFFEAAQREVREEVGLAIAPQRILTATSAVCDGVHSVTVWVKALVVAGTLDELEPGKFADPYFCLLENIPEPRFVHLTSFLEWWEL